MVPFQHVRDSWTAEKLEPRRGSTQLWVESCFPGADFEDMLEAQIHRLEKKAWLSEPWEALKVCLQVVENKIKRARERFEQQKKA